MVKIVVVFGKLRNIFFRSLCLITRFLSLALLQLWCIIVSVCVQAVKCFFCPKLLNIRRERYICRRLCFTTGKNVKLQIELLKLEKEKNLREKEIALRERKVYYN